MLLAKLDSLHSNLLNAKNCLKMFVLIGLDTRKNYGIVWADPLTYFHGKACLLPSYAVCPSVSDVLDIPDHTDLKF